MVKEPPCTVARQLIAQAGVAGARSRRAASGVAERERRAPQGVCWGICVGEDCGSGAAEAPVPWLGVGGVGGWWRSWRNMERGELEREAGVGEWERLGFDLPAFVKCVIRAKLLVVEVRRNGS